MKSFGPVAGKSGEALRRRLPRVLALLGTALMALEVQAAPTVILDTGHTRARQGSTSASGIGEYWFNLEVSDAVARHLAAAGVQVRRVAADGTDVPLAARTRGSADADLFASIHHDSIQQEWIDAGRRGEFAGFAVFTSSKNQFRARSEACGQVVGQALLDIGETPSRYHAWPVKGERRPFLSERLGLHQFDDLVVLKTAQAPAILVEVGVIANPAEEQRLRQDGASRIAQAIAGGILKCLGQR